MKLLFTTPFLEHPPAGGPRLRIENSIKALSRACDLHLISRDSLPLPEFERTAAFFRPFCRELTLLPRMEGFAQVNPYVRTIRRIARLLSGSDLRSDADFILEHVDRHAIDVVWFGYGNISFPLIRRIRSLRPALKLVCDTDSVWSRFVLREVPYAKGPRKLWILNSGRSKQREERAWVELCEVTTAVSEVDAEYYRGLTTRRDRIHLFPNVIDVESYGVRPASAPGFRKPAIYLAGSFGYFHSPMDTAARWVLEKILPRLLQQHPELHFYIVGNDSDKGFGHLNGPNITVTGRLDSVLPYLCHADVALVPLHFESGTRFKILEAGACGIPLVSTTLGAEGIPVADGRDILIADEPEAFANAILRLIEDKPLGSRLAANCKLLVREQFSVDRLARDAQRILAYLDRAPPSAHAG